MKQLPLSPGFIVNALLLTCVVACNSPTNRTPASSGGGETPFGGGGTAPATPAPTSAAPAPASDAAASPATPAQKLAANPNRPDSLHLLSPGRAGRLRIGMSEQTIRALVPAAQLRRTTGTGSNGTIYPAYELRDAQKPDAPATQLALAGDSVRGYHLQRIRITDPQYRTAEGIGVGSPFGVARQTFGLSKVRMTDAGLVAVSRQMRMSWVLDAKSLPPTQVSEAEPAAVPTATRITGVLLY